MRVRVLHAVEPVLHRDLDADVVGRTAATDVLADVRREVATGAGDERGRERDLHRERPHRVRLGLLLVRDGEHAVVDAALDQARCDERRRPADAARRVDTDHRLADRAERVGQEDLRHHHAFERVRGLAEDDGVDVAPRQAGVFERALRGFADEVDLRAVVPLGVVLGLTDADDGARVRHQSPSRTATRFCCRHGPDVACATARSASLLVDRLRGCDEALEARDHHGVARRAVRRTD